MFLLKFLFVVLCLFHAVVADEQFKCEALNRGDFTKLPPIAPSICSNILDYTVAVPIDTCQTQMDQTLSTLPIINTIISRPCQAVVNVALCTKTYGRCNNDSPDSPSISRLPCGELCLAVYERCSEPDIQVLSALSIIPLLDCDNHDHWSFDEATCNAGPSLPIDHTHVQTPKCVEYSGSVCAGAVPGSVFIPPGIPESVLEAAATFQKFSLAVSSRKSRCDIHQQAWICANTFMQCEKAQLGLFKIPVPRLPCNKLCQAYDSSCEPFFSIDDGIRKAFQPDCDRSTFGEVKDCDGNVISPGQPNYPITNTVFATTPIGVLQSSCSNWSSSNSPLEVASAVKQINSDCPAPLVFSEDPSSKIMRIVDGSCSPSCPLNIWTPDELLAFDHITLSGSIISFICALFLSVTWNIFKTERKSTYYLYMNYCLVVLYFFLIANYIRLLTTDAPNGAAAMCKTNVEEYHFEGYCMFQGVVFIYTVLAAVSWWLVQAVDVFRLLVLQIHPIEDSFLDRSLRLGYHCFAWIPPAIVICVALAEEQIGGYAAGSSWCFFSQGRYEQYPTDFSIGLFYYPMLGYTLLGVALMIVVMFRIWFLSTKKENKSKSCWDRYMCNVYLRIILYFFVMSITWFYLFFYKLVAMQKEDEWENGITDFYTCLLFRQFTSGEHCGSAPSVRMPYAMMTFLIFITTYGGLLTFAMHATTFDIYRAWGGLLYDKFHKVLPVGCLRKYSLAEGSNSMSAPLLSSDVPRSNRPGPIYTSVPESSLAQNKADSDKRRKTLFKGFSSTKSSTVYVPYSQRSSLDGRDDQLDSDI